MKKSCSQRIQIDQGYRLAIEILTWMPERQELPFWQLQR